jgi:hypothetical protein
MQTVCNNVQAAYQAVTAPAAAGWDLFLERTACLYILSLQRWPGAGLKLLLAALLLLLLPGRHTAAPRGDSTAAATILGCSRRCYYHRKHAIIELASELRRPCHSLFSHFSYRP